MRNFFQKFIVFVLMLSLAVPTVFLSSPEKAEAQWAVFDAGNAVQNTITAANTTVSSFSNMSLQLKAFVLDTLATTMAKMLIRSITASVVNWINSGFEGSPSFVQNPGSFFLDVADQVTGAFLAEKGGPLTSLCSPFSIDVRIALAFKYHSPAQKRYQCTLGTIIRNSKSAIDTATLNGKSIKGFVGGDFNQGGWPAFVTLTQDTQNNVYGAYLEAESELSFRVASAQAKKKDEIGAGKGFLSWRDRSCVKNVRTAQKMRATAEADPGQESPDGAKAQEYLDQQQADFENEFGPGTMSGPATIDDCPIRTPGSVIVSSLETSTNGPLHELELVDSINEIVNALAAQLVNKMLTAGLSALSGTGPSDSQSYLRQIQTEAENVSVQQLQTVRSNFLQNVGVYIANTLEYKNNKDRSLNAVLETIAAYESARACFNYKIEHPPTYAGTANYELTQARAQIEQIDTILNRDLRPTGNVLLLAASTTESRYNLLISFRDRANRAETINDINQPSQQLSDLLLNQNLISARDIADSKLEYDGIVANTTQMKSDARVRMQQCQLMQSSGTYTP